MYRDLASAPAIARKLGLSLSQVYDSLRRQVVHRRSAQLQNLIRFKNSPLSFNFKKELSRKDRELMIAAVMLYYGEGAKTNTTVDFANSDPDAIKVFLNFLRRVCRVERKRLRFYLYCFANQDLGELLDFWSSFLKVSRQQFTKPYVRERGANLGRTMHYGVLHIRYSDKRLLEKILSLGKKLFKRFK